MSSEKLNEQIGERLEVLGTEELRVIWTENNRAQWSDQAFAAMEVILSERGVDLPSQQEPQYHLTQREGPISYSKKIALTVGMWMMLGAFLIWVLLLAPASEMGFMSTSLSISQGKMMIILYPMQDAESFQMLFMGLIDIKFLIACFGMIAGVLLLMSSPRGVVWAKIYLMLIVLWVIGMVALINVYPFAEIYWQSFFSVIEVEIDFDSLFSRYTKKPGWDLLVFSAKQFWPVIVCVPLWFLFFQRSTWIKKRFCVGSARQNEIKSVT